jgi:hypothetical protein
MFYSVGYVCRWGVVLPRALPVIYSTYGNEKAKEKCKVCKDDTIDLKTIFGKYMFLCPKGHLYGDDANNYHF